MARKPLFRSTAPPLSTQERYRLVLQARRALAERKDLTPAHKARGLLALHKAAERIALQIANDRVIRAKFDGEWPPRRGERTARAR